MTATRPQATAVELIGHDVIEEFCSRVYARTRLSGDGPAVWRHQRVDAGSFALASIEQSTNLECSVEPLYSVAAFRPATMRLELTRDGVQHRFAPGDLQLTAHPDRPYATRMQHGRLDTCVLGLELLSRVAATAPSRRPSPIRFTSLEPRSTTMAAQFWATRSHIADLLANPDAAASPLIVADAANLLAAVTLATFPNSTLVDPTIEDRHDAHPDTLRRAIAFIEANPHRDISIADIAAASFVTVRAVQLAFQRHLDTAPLAYLRRVRLACAHRDLVAGYPDRTTVTEIAVRWGFANSSSFAAYYRAAYGVLPSHTLRERG